MSVAFVFPGQGSQRPGMGAAFYEVWPETRERLDSLSAALDDDLAALCFDADGEALRETRNTQPALFGLGNAVYEAVTARCSVTPDYVAGHSLGHFTALSVAGALDPEAGVSLVRQRGVLLAEAASDVGPGTMLAVLLVSPETVASACADRDDVGVGLYNGPRQTVVSGTDEGVAAVRERLSSESRARFRELDVSAAFHSPVMEPAVEDVRGAMASVDLTRARVPVVSDATCRVYRDPAVARNDLTEQVTSAVDWRGVVERLRESGVDRYAVFPPGNTLAGLIERIDPTADVLTLEHPSDVETLETWAEGDDG